MSLLQCNIWEINQFPRYGTNYNRYTIANIFEYDSNTEVYQSNNFNIQIPEFEIEASDEVKSFINKYKDSVIKNMIPVLVLLNIKGEERWVLDIPKYLIKRISKEM